MRTEAETELAIDAPMDQEQLGLLVLPAVVSCRRRHQEHPLPGGDGGAMHLEVTTGPSPLVVRRRIPSQDLFDGAGEQRGVRTQLAVLVGIPGEGDHAVGNELHDGFMAGDRELLEASLEL